MELVAKVLRTIQTFQLLKKRETILLACSGGADSICLLHVLCELQEDWKWDLQIAHFDHQLRPEAQADERFVRKWASDRKLPYYTRSQDVAAFARKNRINLEEAGRDLRYAFLEEVAAASGAGKIATGHTMDDQAETFLMRMMRGSGPTGLAGIPVLRGDRVVRPLLQVTRSEVQIYLESCSLDFRKDASNQDQRYLRNRIRLDLLPLLQKQFDPQIVPHLGRLTELLQEDEAGWDVKVRQAAEEALIPEDDTWFLDMNILLQSPKALQRRLVRQFLARIRGHLRGISYEDIETIRALPEGRKFTLERGLWLHRSRNRVKVLPSDTAPQPLTYTYVWYLGEKLSIPELDITLIQQVFPRTQVKELKQDNLSQAVLDLHKMSFPLTVRSRKPGDRYRALGAPGRSKLKEMWRAQGIPPQARDRYPLVISGMDIVWVLGLPVSEDFKVSEATQEVLCIRVTKSPS